MDFNRFAPYAIDAFTHVFGEEYRSIISNRMNHVLLLDYYDPDEFSQYLSHLKACKNRELCIRFLEEIGVEIDLSDQKNYAKPFDPSLESIVSQYLYCSNDAFDIVSSDHEFAIKHTPIYVFLADSKDLDDDMLETKMALIHSLRGNAPDEITSANYEAFTKTEEYQQLREKVVGYRHTFQQLLKEYHQFISALDSNIEYVAREKDRKKEMLEVSKREAFHSIFPLLPYSLQMLISSLSTKEQLSIVMGNESLASFLPIEWFSQDAREKLLSDQVSPYEKNFILEKQSNFLEQLGISTNHLDVDGSSLEKIQTFLSFLEQNEVQKYIPSHENILQIRKIREKKYHDTLKQYLLSRSDFQAIMKGADFDSQFQQAIYESVQRAGVCVFNMAFSGKFIFLFTPKAQAVDALDFPFLHECGHISSQNKNGYGFEMADTFEEVNPHNPTKRKYEVFNEAITNIFTEEATTYLHQNGIYLLTPKEFTTDDFRGVTTSANILNLIQPLLKKFRTEIIHSYLLGDLTKLTDCIGEHNFNQLIDTLNCTDYLVEKNGWFSRPIFPNEENAKEYSQQLNRCREIYCNMNLYYKQHFGDGIKSHTDDSNDLHSL